MADHKPSVLIVGGLGYVGRFLALYIHENKLASEVRLVDKVLPQLARLAPEFSEACSQEKFVQADGTKEQSLPRIFDRTNGEEFDYVFNCGGETRYSQEEEVYKARSLALSLMLGREAAKRKCKAFVEVSTGLVYKPSSSPHKESDKTKPWNNKAKYKLKAEEGLSAISDLNLIIMRTAHVYGNYDAKYIGTLLTLARVYKHLDQELKWLWTQELRVNTVHVTDAVRALWAGAEWLSGGKAGYDAKSMGETPIFNIVDHGDTSQGTLSQIIHDVFEIATGFQGTLISTFAKLNLDTVVDDMNDDTLQPWAELLAASNITRPGPLTPYLEKELLKDSDLCLDGSRLEKLTGFKYEKPTINRAEVDGVIESYKRMGWWP